jgi:hypothetical protein
MRAIVSSQMVKRLVALILALATAGVLVVAQPAKPAHATTIGPAQLIAILYVNQVYTGDIYFIEEADQYWVRTLSLKIRDGRHASDSQVMRYNYMDWGTDGCSGLAADRGFYYDFRAACVVHDFGYRNFKKLEAFRRAWGLASPNVWNETRRLWVDQIFLMNMTLSCDRTSWYEQNACRREAKLWYDIVRLFGR